MSQETAEIYAEAMRHLALKARGVVRDVNPKGEMKYMRIRAKRHEVLVAFGEENCQPCEQYRNAPILMGPNSEDKHDLLSLTLLSWLAFLVMFPNVKS